LQLDEAKTLFGRDVVTGRDLALLMSRDAPGLTYGRVVIEQPGVERARRSCLPSVRTSSAAAARFALVHVIHATSLFAVYR
jgi:hypothetical protein